MRVRAPFAWWHKAGDVAVFLGAASDCFDRSSPLIPASAGICAHSAPGARDFGTKRFGSEGYAIEELVAELGTAFLCADLDLTLEPREDHAAYIATWLDILTADNRAIFAAASHAQRAADFINGLIRDRDILGTLAGAPPAWRASLY